MTGRFHHSYETDTDAEAREYAAEMAQTLKELGEYQGCILIALGVMIRSGGSKATLEQVETASQEYSIRFRKIMDRVSAVRLAAPAKNRY